MVKKITSVAIVLVIIAISIIVITGILFSSEPTQENEATDLVIKADVIMPTKVSRPGCEEQDRCYIPSQITIEKGRQITWVNEDSAFHSVTSGFYDAPTGIFDSGYMDPYQSFSFTFETSGLFDYYCTLHPWMAGQILVK